MGLSPLGAAPIAEWLEIVRQLLFVSLTAKGPHIPESNLS